MMGNGGYICAQICVPDGSAVSTVFEYLCWLYQEHPKKETCVLVLNPV